MLKPAVRLLLVLLGVSMVTAMETHCNLQDGAKCYGRLGSTGVFHLMDNISEIPKFEWRHEGSTILRNRESEIYIFIPSNVTFIIKNLTATDSGEYTLHTFDSNGSNTGKRTLQLYVQAPIDSVQLIFECLPQLELKVSCLPMKGDCPKYNWSLDENTLTGSKLLSGDSESSFIILRQNVSGRLRCSVRNHISSDSKEEIISACEDSMPRCALMFVAAILLCGGIGLYFKWKEIKYREDFNKPSETENPDDFEVTAHRTSTDN